MNTTKHTWIISADGPLHRACTITLAPATTPRPQGHRIIARSPIEMTYAEAAAWRDELVGE